ncbi:MAG TPA: hemolysin family protein [Polyangiaceae bacterium]|nr:hemolysin family protein [Polyangiaceae bacterium]
MARQIFWEIALVFLLIVANAVFAAAEIAVVSVRRTRVEELALLRRRGAPAVLALKNDPERFLATVQIGMTVVSSTAAALGGAAISGTLAKALARFPWLSPYADDVALFLVIAAISYTSVVVGELVPKSLALRNAERYALWIAWPMRALGWLASPLVRFLTLSSNVVLRPFRDRTTFAESKYSVGELQQLVDEATEAGTVTRETGEIASRALEFSSLKAADVMIPRTDVVFLPRDARTPEVQRILLEHAHTRLPVFDGRTDDVVGYVNVKDILAFAWDPALFVLEDLIRPAHFVPESLDALALLQDMRRLRTPFAIVVDEQGGMSGIVTTEDLTEELVGEIFSEHSPNVPELIAREPGGTALVSGTTPIREVNRKLDLTLPEGKDYSTIAGLSLSLAGRIPHVGDRIAVPEGTVLEIVDASHRKVRTVRVLPFIRPADP